LDGKFNSNRTELKKETPDSAFFNEGWMDSGQKFEEIRMKLSDEFTEELATFNNKLRQEFFQEKHSVNANSNDSLALLEDFIKSDRKSTQDEYFSKKQNFYTTNQYPETPLSNNYQSKQS
jgi:hypothetical protein